MFITLLKLFCAVLPATVLLWFLYAKGWGVSISKKGLRWAFSLGLISVIMISIIVLLDDKFFIDIFSNKKILSNVFLEEIVKISGMLFLIKKYQCNKELDILILCGMVGLGFGCMENILFVMPNAKWVGVAIVRAISSVPDHFSYSIIMGFFIYKAQYLSNDRKVKIINYVFAFAIPVLMHYFSNYVTFILRYIGFSFVGVFTLLIDMIIPTILIVYIFKYIKKVRNTAVMSQIPNVITPSH